MLSSVPRSRSIDADGAGRAGTPPIPFPARVIKHRRRLVRRVIERGIADERDCGAPVQARLAHGPQTAQQQHAAPNSLSRDPRASKSPHVRPDLLKRGAWQVWNERRSMLGDVRKGSKARVLRFRTRSHQAFQQILPDHRLWTEFGCKKSTLKNPATSRRQKYPRCSNKFSSFYRIGCVLCGKRWPLSGRGTARAIASAVSGSRK